MFEFECWHQFEDNRWGVRRYVAENRSKAKSCHYQYLQDGLWEDSFITVVRDMKCQKIGVASAKSLFGDNNQFESVIKARGIEFVFQGMRIRVAGKMGTVVGGNSNQNLDVVLDGNWFISNCHPLWETVYYGDNGNVVAEYTDKDAVKQTTF